MEFDRNLVPRSQVRRIVLLFVGFWAVILCLALAFASRSALAAMAVNALTTPMPPTVTRFVAATGTNDSNPPIATGGAAEA